MTITLPGLPTDPSKPNRWVDIGTLQHAGLLDVLKHSGAVNSDALARASTAARTTNEHLDLALARLGIMSDVDIAQIVAVQLGLSVQTSFPAHPVLHDIVSSGYALSARLLPVLETETDVLIAMVDPTDSNALRSIAFLAGKTVSVSIVASRVFAQNHQRLYNPSGDVTPHVADLGTAPSVRSEDVERLKDMASEVPVVRSVNNWIERAVAQEASDIHIEPELDLLRVRFRIDGKLRVVDEVPLSMRSGIISRIKILARLDIAEQRLPQDGRFRTAVNGRDIDLRISVVPAMHGESIVLRVLDRSGLVLDLEKLGHGAVMLQHFKTLLRQPNGMILMTGPTGSGKTTTLYAALSRLNAPDRKIFSIEDPVEYELSGIRQTQVQAKIGLDFADMLRSVLRQDPDVILVGEMRDHETAQVAMRAALTGHLVLSTLHTNDAISSLTRLRDLGIDDFLITSSVRGIVAQRLVRKLCHHCATPKSPTTQDREQWRQILERHALAHNFEPTPHVPHGCPECFGSGYKGRTVVAEMLLIDKDIRAVISAHGTEATLSEVAMAKSMWTLRDAGLEKVMSGVTSREEVELALAEAK